MVKWGKPGSWFYFSPEQNLVNIDLMQSLITPDYLRIFLHEEGHRLYTLGMPQRMLDERAEILRLKEESKTRDHTTKAVYIPQASALNVSLVSEILRRTAGNVPVFIERS